MWFNRQKHNQSTIFLVIDDNEAALITCENNQSHHPFVLNSYTALPPAWFLNGAPWHMEPFTTYLHSYVKNHNLKNPLLVCACHGETTYEKTVTLSHTPTQSSVPPDKNFTHYAWHATTLSTTDQEQLSYLISGIPHSTLFRLRLCSDKSTCTLNRVTTLRASMQTLYDYCQRHNILPENTQQESAPLDTILSALCSPQPANHTNRLVLAALGLSLFERKLL